MDGIVAARRPRCFRLVEWYVGFFFPAAFDADVEVNRRLAASHLEEQRWEDAARAAELVRGSARRVREHIAATVAYYDEKRLSADAEVLRRRLPAAAQ